MSVTVLPAGHRGPHTFEDYVFSRPCRACEGEGRELYVEGSLLRAERLAIWGERSLRRMARELGMSPATLSQMERGILDFKEDTARAYLCALGVL